MNSSLKPFRNRLMEEVNLFSENPDRANTHRDAPYATTFINLACYNDEHKEYFIHYSRMATLTDILDLKDGSPWTASKDIFIPLTRNRLIPCGATLKLCRASDITTHFAVQFSETRENPVKLLKYSIYLPRMNIEFDYDDTIDEMVSVYDPSASKKELTPSSYGAYGMRTRIIPLHTFFDKARLPDSALQYEPLYITFHFDTYPSNLNLIRSMMVVSGDARKNLGTTEHPLWLTDYKLYRIHLDQRDNSFSIGRALTGSCRYFVFKIVERTSNGERLVTDLPFDFTLTTESSELYKGNDHYLREYQPFRHSPVRKGVEGYYLLSFVDDVSSNSCRGGVLHFGALTNVDFRIKLLEPTNRLLTLVLFQNIAMTGRVRGGVLNIVDVEQSE